MAQIDCTGSWIEKWIHISIKWRFGLKKIDIIIRLRFRLKKKIDIIITLRNGLKRVRRLHTVSCKHLGCCFPMAGLCEDPFSQRREWPRFSTGGCPRAVPAGLRGDPLLGFTSRMEKKAEWE